MPTTLSPTLQLSDPVINGNGFNLTWTESFNGATLSKLRGALRAIDGIANVTTFGDGFGVLVLVTQRFADINEIARVASIAVANVLTDAQPLKVRTRIGMSDDAFIVVETDYKHTDTRLYAAFKELGIGDVSFSAGGYNIELLIRKRVTGNFGEFAQRIDETINGFYSGTLPHPPLNFVRTDPEARDLIYFEWTLNRRLTQLQVDVVINLINSRVKGLLQISIVNNGHTIIGYPANSFFNKNRLAVEVIGIIEEYFEKLDAAS